MELNRDNPQPNDQLVSSAGTITGGGVLTVTNLGTPLQPGDQFQLFNESVNGFLTVNLPSLGAGEAWQNNVSVDGSIRVVSTTAGNLGYQAGAGQIELSWPADHVGWRLLVQTNELANGLGTNWVGVTNASTTNQISFPINPANGSVFFRLVYP